jgi:hypothetical protein
MVSTFKVDPDAYPAFLVNANTDTDTSPGPDPGF